MSASEQHKEEEGLDALAHGDARAIPRRQHPAGVIQYIIRYAWVFLRSFWPVLAGLAVNGSFWKNGHWIGLGVLALVCVVAVLQHVRFTFQVEGQQLIIRKGVLERERVAISFDRIQMIHIEQAWWQQLLGVAGLRIDTAGSSGAEVEIAALKLPEAKALKRALSAKGGANASGIGEEEYESAAGPDADVLIALSASRLFKIGLTQNHLRNALIAFGSLVAVAEPLEGVVSQVLSNVPDYAWWALKVLWVLLVPLVAVGVLTVGVLISLVGAVIRYYNLRVRSQAEGLEISGGLLKKFEFKVPIHKVQMLEGVSGVLQRGVGFETYKIHQARAQAEMAQSGVNLAIPGLESDHAEQLNDELFPDFGAEKEVLTPHRIWLIRMVVIRLLLVSPILFLGGSFGWVFSGLWGAWLVASAVHQFRRLRLEVSNTQVLWKAGWLRQRHIRAELRKLQRVVVTDNWFLRRRGLVHIRLHTAAGPISMRYVSKDSGKRLRDLALYEVETRREPWM